MEHLIDEQIPPGIGPQPGQICLGAVKGHGHSHVLQRLGERHIGAGFKFGHGSHHRGVFCISQQRSEMLPGEGVHILLHRHPLIGQKGDKGILASGIGLQKARGQIVLQEPRFLAVHHLHRLALPRLGGKTSLPHIRLGVDALPLFLKGQRIDQVHHRIRRYLVQNFLNHAVGLLLHPAVDLPHRSLVKGGLVHAGPVVVGVGLEKVLIDRKVIPLGQPDGVGQTQGIILLAHESVHRLVEPLHRRP